METLHFDKNAAGWTKYYETNKHFLNMQVMYLKEVLAYQDYLYLNRIYETFGIAWDPDRENTCYRTGDNLNIDIWPAEGSDFVIKVYK